LGYADSIEKLSKALKPLAERQDADAAVALLLKPVDKVFKILFVKRVENPADPWSGLLGVIEPLRSTQRPEMKILPFVVLLEHEPSIKLNEELEGFVWISLEELIQHKGMVKFSFGEFPAYIVGNTVIWGLTYRILEKFIHLLDHLH